MSILSSLLLVIVLTLILSSLIIFSYVPAFTVTLVILSLLAIAFYLPLFFFIKYMSQLQYSTELKKRNENIKSFLQALDEYRLAFEDARFYKKTDAGKENKKQVQPTYHHVPTRPEEIGSEKVIAREQFYMRACSAYQNRRYRLESSRLNLDRVYRKLIGFYGVEHKRVEKKLIQLRKIENNWKNWYGQWLNSINPCTRFHLDSNDLEKAKIIINDQNAHSADTTNPVSKNFGTLIASLRNDLQRILDS